MHLCTTGWCSITDSQINCLCLMRFSWSSDLLKIGLQLRASCVISFSIQADDSGVSSCCTMTEETLRPALLASFLPARPGWKLQKVEEFIWSTVSPVVSVCENQSRTRAGLGATLLLFCWFSDLLSLSERNTMMQRVWSSSSSSSSNQAGTAADLLTWNGPTVLANKNVVHFRSALLLTTFLTKNKSRRWASQHFTMQLHWWKQKKANCNGYIHRLPSALLILMQKINRFIQPQKKEVVERSVCIWCV